MVVAKYHEYLLPGTQAAIKGHLKTGLAYGLAMLGEFFVFGAFFYAGGVILEDNEDVNPEHVFIALLAMMFAASQAGMAAAMGPDMGKASAAAERIFRICDTPSTIGEYAISYDEGTQVVKRERKEGGVVIDKATF